MLTAEEMRARACTGKTRYTTLDHAARVASDLNRKHRRRRRKALNAYACRFCGFFHFGHTNIKR